MLTLTQIQMPGVAKAPYGPKFSQFHAVFEKIGKIVCLCHPNGCPSHGESWIHPGERTDSVRNIVSPQGLSCSGGIDGF